MKPRMKKLLMGFGLGFLLFFLFRLVYGYVCEPAVFRSGPGRYEDVQFGSVDQAANQTGVVKVGDGTVRNIVTWKLPSAVNVTLKSKGASLPQVEQKYEKTAYLTAQTDHFDQDENKLRTMIKNHNALVQFEQNTGLEGDRRLQMTIGVVPDKFDQAVRELKKLGHVESINIGKYDRTNEYRELKAKKAALAATRASLVALKEKGGNIEEYIALENRIMELDEQYQTLGLNLDDYDSGNDFCTVKYTLIESGSQESIPVLSRVTDALEWSIHYYLQLVVTVLLVALASFILLALVDRFKLIQKGLAAYYKEDAGESE